MVRLLLILCLGASLAPRLWSSSNTATTIKGTFVDPSGNPLTGKATFTLPYAGMVTQEGKVVPPTVITYPIINGQLPTYASLINNIDILPAPTVYRVAIFDYSSTRISSYYLQIPDVALFDIGTAQQSAYTVSTVSLFTPVAANNTWTGSNSFISSVVAIYGGVSYFNRYTLTDSGVANAINDIVNAGGGTLNVQGSFTQVNPIQLGTAQVHVQIHLLPNTTWNMNVNNPTGYGICLYEGGGIKGDHYGRDFYADTSTGSLMRIAATANILQAITNCAHDGSQHEWYLQGFHLQSQPGATVGTMVDFYGGESGTFVDDLRIDNFTGIGLSWQPPSSGGSQIGSVIQVSNTSVWGATGNTTAQPMVFKAGAGQALVEFTLVNINPQQPGNNLPAIAIAGAGSGTLANFSISHLHMETNFGGTTPVGLLITDASDIHIDYASCAAPGTANDCIKLVQTGSNKLTDISISHATSNSFPNLLNDTIHTFTIAQNANSLASIGYWDLNDATNPASMMVSNLPPTSDKTGTRQQARHDVTGSAVLNGASPAVVTVTLNHAANNDLDPRYTSGSTYWCTFSNETTAANSVKYTKSSGSAFIITGPNGATDTIDYVCTGS